jgi:hypothetical protein
VEERDNYHKRRRESRDLHSHGDSYLLEHCIGYVISIFAWNEYTSRHIHDDAMRLPRSGESTFMNRGRNDGWIEWILVETETGSRKDLPVTANKLLASRWAYIQEVDFMDTTENGWQEIGAQKR